MNEGERLGKGLDMDLGLSADERVEKIHRVAELARMMDDVGLITLYVFLIALPGRPPKG